MLSNNCVARPLLPASEVPRGSERELGGNAPCIRLAGRLSHTWCRLIIKMGVTEADFFGTFAAKVIDTLASEALDEAPLGAIMIAVSELIAVEAVIPRWRRMEWEGYFWRGSKVVRDGRIHWQAQYTVQSPGRCETGRR